MTVIAVDAMGGDHAPTTVLEGASIALSRDENLQLLLVGPTEQIEQGIQDCDLDPARIKIIEAPEVVGMNESPVDALRKKTRSSIRVMAGLLKEGHCHSVFSAGNTGAVVAAVTMGVGLLPGVRRAGILVPFPFGEKPTVLVDAGANIQCKPEHLYQYAVMASDFSKHVYGVDSPRVGVLNVGEEEQKGNSLVKEASKLIAESNLDFMGNIEGGDIFQDECNVVVCDGFVGNIVLKVVEGLSEKLMSLVKSSIAKMDDNTGHKGPVHDSLSQLDSKLDYAETGGAPLLGVAGNVIIGHGRSDAKAVANAIRLAADMENAKLTDIFVERFKVTQ